MQAPQEFLPLSGVTSQEWKWVQDLIRDVQNQEKCEAFVTCCGGWHLAVQQFRKVELHCVILQSPGEDDLLAHAACLHALLAVGNLLLIEARKLEKNVLSSLGFSVEQLAAYVEELESSLREWHHSLSEAELSAARVKIFGG